ncbi:hypothetical protein [Thalassospira profundimaris]|uniref:hypothetical protein n=1 Tax=Thalassospira profundimaris TaxID=502049 RepID=UPI0002871F20|nr:hypothetical protein [Thalassospira profundimaris]EKF10107.1 hypothetical protein TH2_02035 [Thalassospira profundimaris WP0211]
MSDTQNEKNLIHYQKSWEHALHSDQLTAQIGLFALKMVLSVNGAALIAIMAAYPSLAKDSPILASTLPDVGFYMVCGLVAALCCGMLAYFYQGQLTDKRWSEHNANHGTGGTSEAGQRRRDRAISILEMLYIGTWFFSAIFFVIGCVQLLAVL